MTHLDLLGFTLCTLCG